MSGDEIGVSLEVCEKLQFEVARGINRLRFLLLEYRFFSDSEEGSALPLSLPRILSPFSMMLHIFKSHALTLLSLPCYLVKLDARIVGLLAIQENHESVFVASLGTAKEYRRLGIGTYLLGYVEAIAKHMGKRWLEVDVLNKNTPAKGFYTKYGFTFIQSKRTPYVMRGKKPL